MYHKHRELILGSVTQSYNLVNFDFLRQFLVCRSCLYKQLKYVVRLFFVFICHSRFIYLFLHVDDVAVILD